jgi:hypothetical protein
MSPVGGAACEEEEGWCSKREDAIARRVKQLLLTTKESSEKHGLQLSRELKLPLI